MRRARLLAAIVVVGFTVVTVAAQQQRPRIPPTGTIKKVRDNLYVIPGAGGNTTVFVTQNGIVLVDTKLANNGEAILSQIRTVSGRAVSMIINTHSHPDHVGSNDYFPASVEVVAHANTKANMEKMPAFVKDRGVRMAILTVPATAAQEVANLLVQCGITGILNFSPLVLQVPEDVVVNNVNLAIELENLSYFIQN